MKAVDCLRELTTTLRSKGIEDAGKESEILFTGCTGIDRTSLYRDNPTLSKVQINEIKRLLERRQKREPIQYLIGHVDFYGMKIKVGPGVLIPRPETELVVEEAIKAGASYKLQVTRKKHSELPRHSSLNILDLCTGSGCIALAIARRLPEANVYGTDISEKALEYAKENSIINNIRNVIFLQGDLFGPVNGKRFDVVVSNPPYIRRSEITELQPEIREWEPLEALDGGRDGLHFYKGILQNSADYLTDNGSIVLEAGDGEAEDIIKIARDSGLKCLSVIKDYNDIERILHFSPGELY